jgi:hypothetical protein
MCFIGIKCKINHFHDDILITFSPQLYLMQIYMASRLIVRGGSAKSLHRPGTKHATTTKLRSFSTYKYSPRISIHFISRCCNVCKPLDSSNLFLSNKFFSRAMTSASDENGEITIFFFFSPVNRW